MPIRSALPSDFARILALNDASVQFLSPLDIERLNMLHTQSAYHRVLVTDAGVQAFLLALREGASYDSANYRWFSSRLASFLYIDRIVVCQSSQGLGLAKLLYEDLFAYAREAGFSPITCEFDIEPPNIASQRFHQSFGFTEVGRQTVGVTQKRVSLQAVSLDAQAPDFSTEFVD